MKKKITEIEGYRDLPELVGEELAGRIYQMVKDYGVYRKFAASVACVTWRNVDLIIENATLICRDVEECCRSCEYRVSMKPFCKKCNMLDDEIDDPDFYCNDYHRKRDHTEWHKFLDKNLNDLMDDYIENSGADKILPSQVTVFDLMDWSKGQLYVPDHDDKSR